MGHERLDPELPGTREWGCSERSVNTFEPPRVLNVREHEAYVRRNYTPIASSVTVLGIQINTSTEPFSERKAIHTYASCDEPHQIDDLLLSRSCRHGGRKRRQRRPRRQFSQCCRAGGRLVDRSRWHVCSNCS